MNTCCNKLLINKCGTIRQVFVVWFDSGRDDASYHGLIRHPVESTPCTFIAHHKIFNRKLQKWHVIYTITIQWKPGVHIYTHLTHCLPTGQTMCRMKNVYFYGLKSPFPTLFLLCAQQNVTTPLEIIANWWCFKTTLGGGGGGGGWVTNHPSVRTNPALPYIPRLFHSPDCFTVSTHCTYTDIGSRWYFVVYRRSCSICRWDWVFF